MTNTGNIDVDAIALNIHASEIIAGRTKKRILKSIVQDITEQEVQATHAVITAMPARFSTNQLTDTNKRVFSCIFKVEATRDAALI